SASVLIVTTSTDSTCSRTVCGNPACPGPAGSPAAHTGPGCADPAPGGIRGTRLGRAAGQPALPAPAPGWPPRPRPAAQSCQAPQGALGGISGLPHVCLGPGQVHPSRGPDHPVVDHLDPG